MLILERRQGESIFIGKDAEIEVCVISCSGNRVKLGFHAPDSIPIYRNELMREDNANEYYKKATRNVLDSTNRLSVPSILQR